MVPGGSPQTDRGISDPAAKARQVSATALDSSWRSRNIAETIPRGRERASGDRRERRVRLWLERFRGRRLDLHELLAGMTLPMRNELAAELLNRVRRGWILRLLRRGFDAPTDNLSPLRGRVPDALKPWSRHTSRFAEDCREIRVNAKNECEPRHRLSAGREAGGEAE